MHFDHLPYSHQPQFTNPWSSATSNNSTSQLFPSLGSSGLGFDLKSQAARATTMSMPYSSIPASTSSLGAGSGYSALPYGQSDLLNSSHDLLNSQRSNYEQPYSTTQTSSSVGTYPSTSTPYGTLGSYGQSLAQQQQGQQNPEARRLSQTSQSSIAQSQSSFGDALDAGRGMVAMSQTDITPRNIYGPRGDRGSTDSYGFPATHSSHSSISSGSTYPSYFSGSVDSSVSDYSSNAGSIDEPVNSRTLPRPSGLIGTNMPPAPQSMMGQFNSKVSSSTQKKHQCKVCEKRFTRPSSLQTHMYSHTGEKRESWTTIVQLN